MTEATTSRDTVSAPSEAAPAVSAQSTGPGAGRRVLVTGGSRGIGFAVAKRLAEEGYVVAVNGRNAERAEEAAQNLRALGHEAYALPFDVTDRKTAAEVLATDVGERGAFWGVVLNAGINRDGPLVGMSESDFVRQTQSAQEWLDGLIKVWTDGEKESDGIVSFWTESFKSLTAVFSPTPGQPGMLSEASPMRPRRSIT